MSFDNPSTFMFEKALDRATNCFQIHADQRLKLMNFFVILLGGTLALLGVAIKDNIYLLEIATGAAISVITFTFKNLDKRTSSLVKLAERALNILEAQLADHLKMTEIRLVEAAEAKNGIRSYRESFNFLFSVGYGLGALGLGHGVWKIANAYCTLALGFL